RLYDNRQEKWLSPRVNAQMHTRRHFLVGSLELFVPGSPSQAGARCIPDSKLGGQLCKTFIDVKDAYQETYRARRDPAAIWVACVAVVFAKYGHVIQQPRIAAEAYGGLDKVPIESGFVVAKPLVRTWRGDDGAAFQASVEPLFDPDAGTRHV